METAGGRHETDALVVKQCIGWADAVYWHGQQLNERISVRGREWMLHSILWKEVGKEG